MVVAAAVVVLAPLASAPQSPPSPPAPDCRSITDFRVARVGQFPAGWRVREDDGKQVYSVQEEQGRRFLRASSRGLGIQAALAHEWDLERYPVLAWSWRPREFPRGADERAPATNDSALAVYLLVPYSRIRGPRAMKYIWSERVPAGTPLSSNGGLTQVRVLRSGAARRGEWVEERVNVLDDYRKAFEVSKAPRPAGIAVLTDSDDTRSSAQGDYADFRVCRK